VRDVKDIEQLALGEAAPAHPDQRQHIADQALQRLAAFLTSDAVTAMRNGEEWSVDRPDSKREARIVGGGALLPAFLVSKSLSRREKTRLKRSGGVRAVR
jgi:hypothetical protein